MDAESPLDNASTRVNAVDIEVRESGGRMVAGTSWPRWGPVPPTARAASRRWQSGTCNGTDWQKWVVTHPTKDFRTLRNVKTGRCLDDSPAGLRTMACNGTNYQWWYLTIAGWSDLFFQNVHTSNCLDDSNSHGLRAYRCHRTDWQRWS